MPESPLIFSRSRRVLRRVFCGAAAAIAVTAGGAFAQTSPAAPPPVADAPVASKAEPVSYYGVYMQKAKIGSVVMRRDDKAKTADNKPAVRVETQTDLDLRIMGAPAQQKITSITWSEPGTGRPLAQESRTEAGGRVTTVKATYTANSVTYDADIQGETKHETIKLAPGEAFLFDPQDGGAEWKPKIGLTLKGKTFIPEILRLVDTETVIVSQETIIVNGQAVPAYKVLEKNPVGPSTLYVNSVGDLLRVDAMLNMQMRKEPKEIALAPPGGDKPDLLNAVGITPTGMPLDKPRTTKTATYALSGVSRLLPPTDTVQSVAYGQMQPGMDSKTAVITVSTQTLPASSPNALLFRKPSDAPERLRPFLQSTLYVPASDPEFIALAKQVVGKETDAAKTAAKIAAYVHKTVAPDPSIAALRTARDIKKEPRGVCRDYTTFFAAIARAAGLPTKQCVGIAYAGGIFLYHAWPEVWVGKNATGGDQWVALEPTWGMPYADATHIKLAEGEITDLFSVSADIGKYQIQVMKTGQ